MKNEIKVTMTTNEYANFLIKYKFTRPLIIVLYIIFKVFGITYLLVGIVYNDLIIYGITFLIMMEIMFLINYIIVKKRTKRRFGETVTMIHQLNDETLVYIIRHSRLTIPWKEVTFVKITKSNISIYIEKTVIHRIIQSKKRIENFETLKEYITKMSIMHSFDLLNVIEKREH